MNWPTLSGFQIAEQTENKCGLTINPELTHAEAIALIEWLPDNCELSFYDQYYPSNSDPGAYISVRKRFGDVTYQMGNHGWSSDRMKQSTDLLAAWLHLNRLTKDWISERGYHLTLKKISGFSNY